MAKHESSHHVLPDFVPPQHHEAVVYHKESIPVVHDKKPAFASKEHATKYKVQPEHPSVYKGQEFDPDWTHYSHPETKEHQETYKKIEHITSPELDHYFDDEHDVRPVQYHDHAVNPGFQHPDSHAYHMAVEETFYHPYEQEYIYEQPAVQYEEYY